MSRQRTKVRFLSLRRVVFGALGVLAGIAVTVLNGGLNAVGHEIIQKSQVIQSEIDLLQRQIEAWIARRRRPDHMAAMGPDELERLCIKRAMSAIPTEGFPGFIEKKGYCLRKAGAGHAL